MSKIKMINPLVEIDGDEMTRIIWGLIKENLINPYVELKSKYYDLGLKNRDLTLDKITIDAAEATKKYGVAVKCATITPNKSRMEEYNLQELWKSPNATVRSILDGTVFRTPIIVNNIVPYITGWRKPITVARHAYGDIYKSTETHCMSGDTVSILIEDKSGKKEKKLIHDFINENGIVMGIYNSENSIEKFAHSCFKFALEKKEDLWFSSKDTISKIYDHKFKDVFHDIYNEFYKEEFQKNNIEYFYTLIDDAVARVIKSKGGFIWACKNYDGDVMSDLIATAFGSLAMMTSVLVSPDGAYEYEAAHGTVQRHYYKYLNNETTSTNSVATIFAWTGALRKRGELDNLTDLISFSNKLENATRKVIENGLVTKDLSSLIDDNCIKILSTEEFIMEIKSQLELLL